MHAISLLVMFTLVSCGHIQFPFSKKKQLVELRPAEEHLQNLDKIADDFIQMHQKQLVRLSQQDVEYLTSLYLKIFKSNEILLKAEFKPEFYIIDSKIPFYFSMPKARFFFSKSLLTKFLRSEELLIVAISQESIRSHLNLYRRLLVLPTGAVSLETMLNITKLPVETKEELNKWTFSALRRASEDPYALLNLVQLQNKHQMDFLPQFNSVSDIIRCEKSLKNYIAGERLATPDSSARKVSAMFYNFIRKLQ